MKILGFPRSSRVVLPVVLGLLSGFSALVAADDLPMADASSARNPAFVGQADVAQALPFELGQVRLLEGECKRNQDLDRDYLLSLDPDRLLHNFRVNAKLPSTAKPLGGWESPNHNLRGHFVGHYLSACGEMYAATGDQRIKERGNFLVGELGKCQDALGTGYLSAFPPAAFDTIETTVGGASAPYYTIHKIMAGLLDQFHYCGNRPALEMVCKMADYFAARMAKLTPDQIGHALHTGSDGPRHEFGGMSEVLHNLYAITRRPEYLALAGVFDRPALLDPLAAGRDTLAGLHANTHIPQAIGFARHYEWTHDDRYRRAADFFWSQVTSHHSYVTGSDSRGEIFLEPDKEAGALSADAGETCNVYNMLKLTQHVFAWKPDAAAADYAELALYNHILPSIDPDSAGLAYYISLAPGHFKLYGKPDGAFWCCTGTGVENHAKYGEFIYAHSEDALWVNLFVSSQLSWPEKGVSLVQSTAFPESDHTTLTFTVAEPTPLKVLLRVPAWTAPGMTVTVNGEDQHASAPPGSYLTLARLWKTGDKIDLRLPMSLRLHRATDNPKVCAIMYGPLVLAADLGRDGMPADDKDSYHRAFMKIADPKVPGLSGDGNNLDAWIKPVAGKPLTFTTVNASQPDDVRLQPFYYIHHERYTLYWHFLDTARPVLRESVGGLDHAKKAPAAGMADFADASKSGPTQ